MRDAGLMGCAGKGRFETAGHAAQTIRYCNQDVLDTPRFEFIKNIEPEGCAFGIIEPQTQHCYRTA